MMGVPRHRQGADDRGVLRFGEMEPALPARLHVLLSRDKDRGLIVRRGPARAVATVDWDRRRDTFRVGQWLRGRIYERRCDLSHDGKYLIYFAMNGHWGSESRGAWTAISHAPYLKALVMLPKGDCWHGGGLFTRGNRYWLNDGYGHQVLHDSREVSRDPDYRPERFFGGECPGVYYLRLLRDGWSMVSEGRDGDLFEKNLPGGWVLRKHAHASTNHPPGTGCYWDQHELVDPAGKPLDTLDALGWDSLKWEWADLDCNRLVWTSEGKLFAARFTGKELGEPKELFDANELEFERLQAPY